MGWREVSINGKVSVQRFIAARVAKELKDGDVLNLGIGLPTLVPNYLPEGIHVTLQAENGTIVPLLLRTYQRLISSGSIRYFAAAWT